MNRSCAACGKDFEATGRKRFCDRTGCKRERARARKRVERGTVIELPARPEDAPTDSVERATRAELERYDKLGSSIGQAALALARRLDDDESGDTGSSRAQLAGRLQALMAEAGKGAAVAADQVDELKERRKRRIGGA